MAEPGRHQCLLFDSWNATEVLQHIQKFEAELSSSNLMVDSPAGSERQAELLARIEYLRARFNGRRYEAVAEIGQVHATDCPVYRAARGSVAVECEHGYDCCPDCDVCNCALVPS
jgi:hypothetical protein